MTASITPAFPIAAAPPRLRPDLTFAPQETPERRFVVVKDPLTGKYFKLGEADEFIARQFDGATPLDEIRQRVARRFDAAVETSALDAFAKALEHAGLLDDGVVRRPKKQKRIRAR